MSIRLLIGYLLLVLLLTGGFFAVRYAIRNSERNVRRRERRERRARYHEGLAEPKGDSTRAPDARIAKPDR